MAEPLRWRRVVLWVAVGLCLSVAVLTWFGLRAIRQWRQSSVLLMQQRADEAASILATALTRDMQAVQRRVLASGDWLGYLQDSPSDLSSVAASAFARYPYPDTFFAIRNSHDPAAMLFFTRTDRMPAWMVLRDGAGRVPVAVVTSSNRVPPTFRYMTFGTM